MAPFSQRATAGLSGGTGNVPGVNTARQLVGIDVVIPGRVAMSRRGWLRACEGALAPWGYKIGGRRMWDLAEIDAWIAGGCKPVRDINGEDQR